MSEEQTTNNRERLNELLAEFAREVFDDPTIQMYAYAVSFSVSGVTSGEKLMWIDNGPITERIGLVDIMMSHIEDQKNQFMFGNRVED